MSFSVHRILALGMLWAGARSRSDRIGWPLKGCVGLCANTVVSVVVAAGRYHDGSRDHHGIAPHSSQRPFGSS